MPAERLLTEILTWETLRQLERRISQVQQPIIVLSDFDHTLCGQFSFRPETNDHHPELTAPLIAAAQSLNLVIATGRRANNPAIPWLWECGLISPHQTIITENGGVLVTKSETGLHTEVLIPADRISALMEVESLVRERVVSMPAGQQLIFKRGKTFLIARLQDEAGELMPENQGWLAAQIQPLLASSGLQAIDTRASVTIQANNSNKGTGFLAYLERHKINRSDVFVVGMGDADNDREIFKTADLRLGFSEAVRPLVDLVIPGGASTAAAVLKVLHKPLI